MRNFYISISIVLLLFAYTEPIQAQYTGPEPTVTECVYHDVSPPLKDIVPHPSLPKAVDLVEDESPESITPPKPGALPIGEDPVWQKENGSKGTVTPYQNFEALRNSENSSGVAPPDSDGDIGPNHYFAMVNNVFQIFNRTGVSLFGPAGNTTIWDGWSGYYGQSISDPIVLYDEHADRWFASVMTTSTYGGNYHILCAVSTTPDPTGTWNRYAWAFNSKADYPKYGIWPDGYYVGLNRTGDDVLVLERSAMLTGALADMVSFDNPNKPVPNNTTFNCVLPSDCDGEFPAYGTPNYFWAIGDDAWAAYSYDRLLVWEFHVDWGTPANSTWIGPTSIPTAAFDATFNAFGVGEITQPGTSQVLDCIPWILMYRPQFRNFGGYFSLVCNHSVDVDATNHAGVRWYELRKTTGGWYIRQQNTYSPDGDNRWMGSVAMNGVGDIALGYSVSSTSTYPSIRFTGRLADDPLGTMTFTESNIWAGSYSQTDTRRWGDYSMMSVDPVNDRSFWYTSEYASNYGGWADWVTQVAAFSLNNYCAAGGGCTEYISRVEVGDIDNTTACDEYSDFTNLSTNIVMDETATLTVTNGAPFYLSDQCGVWIDWNRDDDFDDAGETILTTSGIGPYTTIIDPPDDVTLGDVRMRIRVMYTGIVDPCGIYTYGEVEDYTIKITGSTMPIPAQTGTFTGNSRGYWFEAPTDFTISGFRVPTDNPGAQTVEVIRFNSGPPPLWSTTTNDFVSLGRWVNVPGGDVIPCNISVSNGDWIGVLGCRGTTTSYGAAPYVTSIDGYPVTLTRMGMQYELPSTPAQDIFQEASGSLGRVEMFYELHSIWTGIADNNWNNPDNWFSLFVPDINNDVVIPAGCPNYPELGGHLGINTSSYTYDCKSLNINPGASVTLTGTDVYNYGELIVDGTLNVGDDFFLYSGSTVDLYGTISLGMTTGWYGHAAHYSGSVFNQTGGNYYVETITLNNGCQFNGTGGTTHMAVNIESPPENTIEIHDPDSYFYYFIVDAGANAVLYNCTYDLDVSFQTYVYGSFDIGSFTMNVLYMDVYGGLNINSGGLVNVTGNGPWFHSGGGSLTMSSGSELNSGSTIWFQTGSIENVSGGEIFLGSNFTDSDNIFSPTGGSVTFDGGSSAGIYGPTTFYDLFIDKTGGDKSSSQVNNKESISIDYSKANIEELTSADQIANELLTDETKANDVFLNSNVTVNGSLTIANGSLRLNGNELTVGYDCDVYGSLTMDDPADILNIGTATGFGWLELFGGSTANLLEGTVYIPRWLVPRAGCNFSASTNNTIIFIGNDGGGPSNFEPSATYGNIVINKDPAQITYVDGGATEPIIVNGNCTVNPNNTFDIQNNTMVVHGILTDNSTSAIKTYTVTKDGSTGNENSSTGSTSNGAKGGVLEIDNDFTLNGLLDVGDGDVLIHGHYSSSTSATLNIGIGTFICDAPTTALSYIRGIFNLDAGLLEITNNHISMTALTSIAGGTIRCGGSFIATPDGNFQPTAGAVELIGTGSTGQYISLHANNYFHDLTIDRTNLIQIYITTAQLDIKNDFTIINGGLNSNTNDMSIGGNWTNTVGSGGFAESTGTVIFNNPVDILLSSVGGENFNNLTIDKGSTGDVVSLQDNIDIAGETTINSGALYSYNNIVSTNGNVTINSGGWLYLMTNGVLELADGMSFSVNSGGYFYAIGSAANEPTVTHNTSGVYNFNINSGGMIGAQHAIFEFMNANGINVGQDGLVNSTYSFNHCIFRNGHPAPSALLVLNGSNIFTSTGAYFEDTPGTTGYNVWKYWDTGNAEFVDATGNFQGEDHDYDPYYRVDWTYTTRTLDLTVFLEGPYNTGTGKLNTDINSYLPLSQPYNPPLPYYGNPLPDWYYTGIASVGTIPNVFVVDWVLLQLRDATSAAAASSASAFATIPAFILNTGEIVDLDGLNPVTFLGSVVNDLFVVIWHRNHLGIISANALVEVGGTYTYNFSTGETQVYGGANGHKELEPGVWGMVAADGDGNGLIQLTDAQGAATDDLGLSGYLGGDFDMNSLGQLSDKQDVWLPNLGTGGQIPAKGENVNSGYASQVPE